MRIKEYKFRQNHISIAFFGIISFHIPFNKTFRKWVHNILQKRMKRKLRRIAVKSKIRVGFLVSEQSKWAYQSVYEEFANNPRYEPVILLTKLYLEHRGRTSYYQTMDDCYTFFKNKNMNIEIAYDTKHNKYIPIKKLNIDILFYQQPWELDIVQHPLKTSKYAITAYTPYGFDLIEYNGPYLESFHRFLDVYFTATQSTLDYINTIAKDVDNCRIVGAPKLDRYFDVPLIKHKKPIVIYAPHHSFERGGLQLATFEHNGQEILDIARKTKNDIDWVFKPHPRFMHAVISNNIMTENAIKDYYNQWSILGKVYEGGDYIDLFKNSDGLITDCCAFLAEYLPSGAPVFHLISEYAKFNDTAKSFIDSYYKITQDDNIYNEFARVILNHDDYKARDRKNKIKLIFDEREKTATKMKNIIESIIGGKK